MALIILRSRFNEAARRAIGQPGAGQKRVEIFRDLCTELGFETIDGGRSTTGEAVSGSPVLQLAALRGRAACPGRAHGRRCGFSKLEGFALFTFSSQGAQRWKLQCSDRRH